MKLLGFVAIMLVPLVALIAFVLFIPTFSYSQEWASRYMDLAIKIAKRGAQK